MENTTENPEDYILELYTKDLFETSNETNIEITTFKHVIRVFVTVSPYWEKLVILIYGLFILLFGTAANCLVLLLTARHKKFHEPYMYIRAAYAVIDILFAWFSIPIVFANLFLDEGTIPTWLSCYFSAIGIGMFLCTVHLTSLIALERYFFFCHPFLYERIFRLKIIAATCIIMIALTQAYMVSTEVYYGRELQFVLLMCQLDDPFHNTFQTVVWVLASLVIVVFSIVNIQCMIGNLEKNEVFPANHVNNMEPTLRKKAGRRAIK